MPQGIANFGFGTLAVIADQQVIDEYVSKAGIGSNIKIHKVLRVLDPSLAGPRQG